MVFVGVPRRASLSVIKIMDRASIKIIDGRFHGWNRTGGLLAGCRFRTWLKDNQARLQLIALVDNLRNFLWPADLGDLVGTDARAREEATAADHPSRFDRAGDDAAHRFENPVSRIGLLPSLEPGRDVHGSGP